MTWSHHTVRGVPVSSWLGKFGGPRRFATASPATSVRSPRGSVGWSYPRIYTDEHGFCFLSRPAKSNPCESVKSAVDFFLLCASVSLWLHFALFQTCGNNAMLVAPSENWTTVYAGPERRSGVFADRARRTAPGKMAYPCAAAASRRRSGRRRTVPGARPADSHRLRLSGGAPAIGGVVEDPGPDL